MDLGPMGNLAPKLRHLLKDEYNLHKDVKKQVRPLAKELESMHCFLSEVTNKVPSDQLDPPIKLWASAAREASYDWEDVLDTLLVRLDDRGNQGNRFPFMNIKFKAGRETAGAINDMVKQVYEMIKLHHSYMNDNRVAYPAAVTSTDPRVSTDLHTNDSELVGIDRSKDAGSELVGIDHSKDAGSELVGIDYSKDALVKLLTLGDDKEMKIVSVVGHGGLGKTTLAKVVYDKLTVDLNISCKAFVVLGPNPNLRQVFMNILLHLNRPHYMNNPKFDILNERQLVDEIRAFLKEKRYFIVIDDVWEVSSWKAIRIALKDNNLGSKVMITTRRLDVAESVQCTYKIQSLRPDSSKLLFYNRIFGGPDKCPDFLSELSDKFLKKCEGLPLAIITLANLLAKKSHDIAVWQELYLSLSSELGSVTDYKKILLLSYYELPSHLKLCFLYLSMFPEDYEIRRDELIWRWICEGFIQPRRINDDLFELGISYFNELISTSMVQPAAIMDDGIYACRVHVLIIELVCSLSREENFVTSASEDIEQVMSSKSKKLRRLSLKNTTWPKKDVSQVRSIALFGPCIDSMPSFSCLNMVRVLDLEGCSLEDCGGSKLSVGNLIHLRYLGLRGTGLKVPPLGIEKLQSLQVLKMDGDIELPESIFGLRRLMCLDGVRCCARQGNSLGNLASLQVLDTLYLDKDSVGVVKALCDLMQLTVLEIFIKLEMVDFYDALMESVGTLPRLQFLRIMCDDLSLGCWASSPCLKISPPSLPHLRYLDIMIQTVGPEDIQILGGLPNLVALQLEADYRNYLEQPLQKFIVDGHLFPKLKRCFFRYVATVPSMFTTGTMPRVEYIRFCLRAWDFFSDTGLKFADLAMDHLPSLKTVSCVVHGETDVTGEEEVKELRKEVKRAADVHPNHPELSILKEIGRA